MEMTGDLLLQEARQQWILRISGTDSNGKPSITTPEQALQILRCYGPQVQASGFPERLFWMLK